MPRRAEEDCTVGPIGRKPTVSAECMFVDPVSDLAVLGPPDNQDLSEECDAYEAFVEQLAAFSTADILPTPLSHEMPEGEIGWVFSLAGKWQQCRMSQVGGPLWLSGASIDAGMSGSPILSANGRAVGVIVSNHAQPRLWHGLPSWIFRAELKREISRRMERTQVERAQAREAPRAKVKHNPPRGLDAIKLGALSTLTKPKRTQNPARKKSAKMSRGGKGTSSLS